MKNYSNYHSTNVNDKMMHDGLLLLQNSLNGFQAYDVVINDTKNTKVLFYDKYDAQSTTKKIIGYVEDIELGNLFNINNENWLVTTYPEDNRVYRKAEVQLCNSTFPIESKKTKVLIGYNDFGEPMYETTEGEPILLPCIVEYTTLYTNTTEAINLPEGQINVTLQYIENECIAEGKEFTMYNTKYQIIGVDYTKSINKVGLLTIKGRKVQ